MAGKEIRFTPERLRELTPPAAGRDVYRDTDVKGLELRVTASGVKTFSFYRWVPATQRPERITLGRFTGKAGGMTIDAARKLATGHANTLNEAKSPALERKRRRDSDTFEAAFTVYMRDHVRPHLKEKTAKGFQQLYDDYIVPSRMHRKKLAEIEHEDVKQFHVRLGAKSKRNANKVAGLIRAVFNDASTTIKSLSNPVKGLPMFDTPGRDRFVSVEEFPRYFTALADTPQPFRDVFELLRLTGVRLGNALAAVFNDFDLTHARWTMAGAKRKNKRTHSVPLSPEAVELVKRRLAAVPKGTPWLFPSTGKRPSASGHITKVSEPWADLCERAELNDLRRHDMRHTLASYMVMAGEGLPLVGAQLGHISAQSTERYAHFATDATRSALESTLAKMSALATAKPNPAQP